MVIPLPEELLLEELEAVVPLTPSASATAAPAQSPSLKAFWMSDSAARTREAGTALPGCTSYFRSWTATAISTSWLPSPELCPACWVHVLGATPSKELT